MLVGAIVFIFAKICSCILIFVSVLIGHIFAKIETIAFANTGRELDKDNHYLILSVLSKILSYKGFTNTFPLTQGSHTKHH